MKKILLILFLMFSLTISGMALTYTSQYPPEYTSTYVKATTNYSTYYPHLTCNPAMSLIGSWATVQWLTAIATITNQRFHVDLDSAKIIRRIYYENSHLNGVNTDHAVQNFTFWGSNTEASFLELTYGTDTGWTQLSTSQATFDQHIGANQTDPKYITVTNTVTYQYYAFKFADGYGGERIGVRRIELQTEDDYGGKEDNAILFGFDF